MGRLGILPSRTRARLLGARHRARAVGGGRPARPGTVPGGTRWAGAVGLVRDLARGVLGALVFGPTPVSEAVPRVELVIEAATPVFQALGQQALATLRAMEGRTDEARRLLENGWETAREAGYIIDTWGGAQRF